MEPGKPFGKYVLLKRIAVGGMGEVYLAQKRGPRGFSMPVAIKVILPYLGSSQRFTEMFFNEAQLAAQLNHPNIVRVYDFGLIEETYFIEMEYVQGENLATVIDELARRKARLPDLFAAKIGIDVCKGLDYAHTKRDDLSGEPLNIIHRDISPQNILISYNGEVKITDFGIAKRADDQKTKGGMLKGKYSYMSPEQVLSNALDKRSDIFSLGVVLYEMVTGVRPFDRRSDYLTLEAIKSAPVPPMRKFGVEVDERFEAIVARALAKDPAARFPSARVFRRELEAYLQERHRRPTTIDLDTFLHDMFEEKIAEKEAIKLLSQAAEESAPAAAAATSPSAASSGGGNASSERLVGSDLPPAEGHPPPLPKRAEATDRMLPLAWAGTLKRAVGRLGRWTAGEGRNLLLGTLIFAGAIAGGVGIYHLLRPAGTEPWVVRTGVADVAVLLDGKQIATTDEAGIAVIEGIGPRKEAELHFVHPCYETATLSLPGGGKEGGRRDLRLSPRMAQLDIYTDPPGAEVSFDGKTQTSTNAFGDPVPARTPLRLSSIQACVPHEIEIHKTGFVPWKKSFVLSAGEETAITVQLERSKELGEMGGVLLSSIPEGCRIFIDGQPLEQKTPAEVRLPGGKTYEIVLRKEGFEEWKTEMPIEAGLVRKLLARLEVAYGFVAFDIDPPVDVHLDGKIHRRPSPKTFFKVPAGEHDVTFSRRDLGIHRTERIRVEAHRYRTVRRRFPALLSVRVKSDEAVEVYVDDRFVGTTPIVAKEIPHGRHDFLLVSTLDPGKRKKIPFTTRAGQHYEVVIDLLEAGIVAQIEKKPSRK